MAKKVHIPVSRKAVPHPSGRPRAMDDTRRLPIYRVPLFEPINPRLQFRDRAPAIGFHVIQPDSE